VSGLHILK